MPLSLLRAATSLVGNRWAKPLIYVALAVLLIVGVGVVKCTYDNHIIEQHEAERDAIVERSARQASEGATAKSDTAREQEALRQAEIAKDAHNAKQSPESNNPAGPVSSAVLERLREQQDRKSTRLNSSHSCEYSMPSSA